MGNSGEPHSSKAVGGLTSSARLILSLLGILFASQTLADVGVDIRTSSAAVPGSGSTPYVLAIEDCTSLVSVAAGAAGSLTEFAPDRWLRDPYSPASCSVAFTVVGPQHLEPIAELVFANGVTESYSEVFYEDTTPPDLELSGVSISTDGERQFLVAEFAASDDQDIAYLSASVWGLRASDLRNAGGVVDEARRSAFASTPTPRRLHPVTDDQTLFMLELEIDPPLDAAAIASDGVVIVDAILSDAAGLQDSLSRISFTGDDVTDTAIGMEVRPDRLLFTNVLETAVLIPYVDFQFRGPTPLGGAGNGVTYGSSHPDLVFVTAGGLVYPLAETEGELVTITASFPGLPDVVIEAEVDFTKTLEEVRLQGVSESTPLVIPSLNSFIELPVIEGVFDDGSVAPVTTLTPSFTLPVGTESILSLDSRQRILARAIIPPESPAQVEFTFLEQPRSERDLPGHLAGRAPHRRARSAAHDPGG